MLSVCLHIDNLSLIVSFFMIYVKNIFVVQKNNIEVDTTKNRCFLSSYPLFFCKKNVVSIL